MQQINRFASSVLLACAVLLNLASCERRSDTAATSDPAVNWSKDMHDALAAREARQFQESERLYKRALAVAETFGTQDARLATTLHDYAEVCRDLEKEDRAEAMHRRSLAIRRTVLGAKHRDTAQSLTDLSTLCSEHGGRLQEAEALLREAIPIWETVLPPDHSILAYNLDNLAVLYTNQGKYAEALPLYERAIEIWKKGHPESQVVDLAWGYQNFAYHWEKQGQFDKAEPLYEQAVPLFEKAFGREDFQIAAVLNRLAAVSVKKGHRDIADNYYRRVMEILAKSPGHEDFKARAMWDYAVLLDAMGKAAAAEKLRQQIPVRASSGSP